MNLLSAQRMVFASRFPSSGDEGGGREREREMAGKPHAPFPCVLTHQPSLGNLFPDRDEPGAAYANSPELNSPTRLRPTFGNEAEPAPPCATRGAQCPVASQEFPRLCASGNSGEGVYWDILPAQSPRRPTASRKHWRGLAA